MIPGGLGPSQDTGEEAPVLFPGDGAAVCEVCSGPPGGVWQRLVAGLGGVFSLECRLVQALAFPHLRPLLLDSEAIWSLVPAVTSPRGPRVTQVACLLRCAWEGLLAVAGPRRGRAGVPDEAGLGSETKPRAPISHGFPETE